MNDGAHDSHPSDFIQVVNRGRRNNVQQERKAPALPCWTSTPSLVVNPLLVMEEPLRELPETLFPSLPFPLPVHLLFPVHLFPSVILYKMLYMYSFPSTDPSAVSAILTLCRRSRTSCKPGTSARSVVALSAQRRCPEGPPLPAATCTLPATSPISIDMI